MYFSNNPFFPLLQKVSRRVFFATVLFGTLSRRLLHGARAVQITPPKKNTKKHGFLIWALLSFLFLFSCSTRVVSNFDVSQYEGVTLTGETIRLSEAKVPLVGLNIYSSTCVPCVKEIPTLNYLYLKITEGKLGELYLVVDPYQIVEGSETLAVEEVFAKANQLMKMEVTKHSISLPVLLMKKPFTVDPKKGLITGTPETLLFKTSPLVLFYNFIGPISEKQKLEDIQTDNKVKFFLRMFGGF